MHHSTPIVTKAKVPAYMNIDLSKIKFTALCVYLATVCPATRAIENTRAKMAPRTCAVALKRYLFRLPVSLSTNSFIRSESGFLEKSKIKYIIIIVRITSTPTILT